MPVKNYYVILGVDESETASGIRAAFRDMVKRYHPDRVGPEGTQQLQDVIEAYQHLSDRERRRRYNESLRAPFRPAPAQRPEAEPLIPEPASIFNALDHVRPSPEALFDRFFRNFSGVGAPKAEHPEALNLDVVLSPEEAHFGVDLPLRLPVFHRCPRCDGSGHDWLFPCRYCLQTGFIENQKLVRIQIPPGVRDGSIANAEFGSLGVRNLYLRLHIRVR